MIGVATAANYVSASQQGNPMNGRFGYVYMLQSIDPADHWYVGMTEDLDQRLEAHNAGKVPHTSKFLPWRLETAVAFWHKSKAIAFEKYLKTQSGRAFARRHL